MRISDWSSDVCSSDLGSNARFRCRIRSPKRSSPNTPPTRRRLRQRPERRTLIGADTAMVRPLGFLVGLGFITALVLAILTTPLIHAPNVDRKSVGTGRGVADRVSPGGALKIKKK